MTYSFVGIDVLFSFWPTRLRLLQENQILSLSELNCDERSDSAEILVVKDGLNWREKAADRDVAIPPHFTPRLSRKKRLSLAAEDRQSPLATPAAG